MTSELVPMVGLLVAGIPLPGVDALTGAVLAVPCVAPVLAVVGSVPAELPGGVTAELVVVLGGLLTSVPVLGLLVVLVAAVSVAPTPLEALETVLSAAVVAVSTVVATVVSAVLVVVVPATLGFTGVLAPVLSVGEAPVAVVEGLVVSLVPVVGPLVVTVGLVAVVVPEVTPVETVVVVVPGMPVSAHACPA